MFSVQQTTRQASPKGTPGLAYAAQVFALLFQQSVNMRPSVEVAR